MLERDDLITFSDKVLDEFLAHPPLDALEYTLRLTSGTSGNSPLYNLREHSHQAFEALSNWYWGTDRVLLCFGPLVSRFINCEAQKADPEREKQVLALDATDLTPDLAPLLSDFKPQRIIGFPSFIARAAEFFDEEAGRVVQSLKCPGEPVTNTYQELFSKKFPNASVGAIYWTIELDRISKETCGHRPLNFFHPFKGVDIEIRDPDEHGVGDILISAPFYKELRAEKYRIGDMGRIHPGVCACGEKVTFELVGRPGYNYIRLNGALLIQTEFDRVAALFPIIREYRVEGSTEIAGGRTRGTVTLLIYGTGPMPTQAKLRELEAQFSQVLFVTPTETLTSLVEKDLFRPLTILWSQSPFPSAEKDFKLKQI